MHMHQVDPSSKLIGSNFDLGSQGSKGFFFTKNAVTSSIRLTLPVPLAKGAVSSFFLYPAGAAAGSCFLLVSSFFFFLLLLLSSSSSFFFLLATHLFHTFPYILFWPNLVTMTGTLTTTQAQKMVGSGVTMGSLGSKRSFAPKRHQVLQIT